MTDKKINTLRFRDVLKSSAIEMLEAGGGEFSLLENDIKRQFGDNVNVTDSYIRNAINQMVQYKRAGASVSVKSSGNEGQLVFPPDAGDDVSQAYLAGRKYTIIFQGGGRPDRQVRKASKGDATIDVARLIGAVIASTPDLSAFTGAEHSAALNGAERMRQAIAESLMKLGGE